MKTFTKQGVATKLQRLVEQEVSARLRYKRLKAQAESAEAEANACKEAIIQLMQQSNMVSTKLSNGLCPRWKAVWKAYRNKECDVHEFIAWHKANGMEHLVTERVNPTSKDVIGTYTEFIEKGGKLPEHLFDAREMATLTIAGRDKFENQIIESQEQ